MKIVEQLIQIINEEFKKCINESYVVNNDDFKFQQQIVDSEFLNYESFTVDFDLNISESMININWSIGFWLNNEGIEHFYIKVDDISGTYTLRYLNKQTDEIEQEVEKNINDVKWKFIVNDVVLQINESLYVSSLQFDFKSNVCTVVFS